jgi:antitoxin CcdA
MRISNAIVRPTMTRSAPATRATRRPTNVSIDAQLLEQARGLKINLSRTLEQALGEAVRRAQADQWREENRRAIESYNERVAKHGTFSDKMRRF